MLTNLLYTGVPSSIGEGKYKCPQCPNHYKNKWSLLSHIGIHIIKKQVQIQGEFCNEISVFFFSS